MKSHHRRFLPYGVALAAVSVAVLLALWLRHSEGKLAFPLSFAAVMVSAWYGGLGPGLFAAILVGIASICFLFPPTGSFKVTAPRDVLHLGLFALAAIVISLGQAKLLAARRQIEEQALEVEGHRDPQPRVR